MPAMGLSDPTQAAVEASMDALADRTRLADGSEVSKTDARVEAYGAVDEANACIGLARLHTSEHDTRASFGPLTALRSSRGRRTSRGARAPGHRVSAHWQDLEVHPEPRPGSRGD